MKQFYFIMICLLVSGAAVAQEKLSKEEKERREKNIQAANPFAKFGYKAKVATLSKGKYLEVHDLDSIVTIGSVRFHVDRKEIVGFIEPDTINGEYARPVGDIASRWLSPDPLAEEFPSWSPYTFVYNNPLKFTDPTGMAPEAVDFKPDRNGNLIVEKGDTAEKLKQQYGVTVADKDFQFKEGNVILLNNNMTRSIERSNGVTSDTGSTKGWDNVNDCYVCDQASQMAVAGVEITPKNANNYKQFTENTSGFSEVKDFSKTKFGDGVAMIGTGLSQHIVANYGKSNDGTQYVYSKDGMFFKPEVKPLSDVVKQYGFKMEDVRYFQKVETKK
ncbi:MAG: hypothetical protein E2604_16350 [Flavobacterium sp.]|nr:hypothetical protein [Flavobacterium sp.]